MAIIKYNNTILTAPLLLIYIYNSLISILYAFAPSLFPFDQLKPCRRYLHHFVSISRSQRRQRIRSVGRPSRVVRLLVTTALRLKHPLREGRRLPALRPRGNDWVWGRHRGNDWVSGRPRLPRPSERLSSTRVDFSLRIRIQSSNQAVAYLAAREGLVGGG